MSVDSGTKVWRTRFPFVMRKQMDIMYGRLYPTLMKFCLPGDVWRLSTDCLIRYQPMIAPSLTPCKARFRFFFVPLRLLEDNTELVITGSKDGHYDQNVTIPSFAGIFDTVIGTKKVDKFSILDYFGLPVGSYSNNYNAKSIPAAYWYKAYCRIWWDYYRDENLYTPFTDFNSFVTTALTKVSDSSTWYGVPFSVALRKDYFTASLPWQLKGIAPTVNVQLSGNADFSNAVGDFNYNQSNVVLGEAAQGTAQFGLDVDNNTYQTLLSVLNNNSVSLNQIGLDAAQLRAMFAQTRVFERLARCGSRYTEYLRANFGISPADGTLQRAQYLGGYSQPIVVADVVQTAGAVNSQGSQTPVGSLRGKGISRGGDSIKSFHCKEFGVLFGVMDVRPQTMYTQGINRELTYKSRFDFFNPSFQHLSEQVVRNGEVYIGNDGLDDGDWGFEPYAQELRVGRSEAVGDMRDALAYWNQAISFSSRPSLNYAFVRAVSHIASFNKPFQVSGSTISHPMIVDFAAKCDVYRPMVRNATPGLIDHL